MNILALDLATKTGWAAYHKGCGGAMNSGIQDFAISRLVGHNECSVESDRCNLL